MDNDVIYTTIKKRARDYGITIQELCERSGVSRDSMSYWKHKNPATVTALMKLEAELKKMDNLPQCANEKCKIKCKKCTD